MNHDDLYIYVFVRQDLPIAEQLVHATHAAYHAGNLCFPLEGIPNLVVIGLPHVGSLAKAVRKLKEAGIEAYVWNDTDTNYGPTAIATQPLPRAAKDLLKQYRLYAPGGNTAAQAVPTSGLNADGRSTGRTSSEKEHSVSNGEVAGSIPACGSNSANYNGRCI